MQSEFEPYTDRRIDFLGSQAIGDWKVKVYTITMNEHFQSKDTLNAALRSLDSEFIAQAKLSELPTHRHAFLITHEAREGVWILFSWWTGGEMVQTMVRFASYENPLGIYPSPHSGSLVCTWELEVYQHERAAWIRHVLKQSKAPDFMGYLNDGLNG